MNLYAHAYFLSIQKKTIVDRENNPFDNRGKMLDEIQEIGIRVMRSGMSHDLNNDGTLKGIRDRMPFKNLSSK